MQPDVDALAQGEQQPAALLRAVHNCHVRQVQPQAGNRHAVFLCGRKPEAITYFYDRDLRIATPTPDPRIAHTLNLGIDEYGNIQQAVSVVYGRLRQHADDSLPADALALIQEVQQEPHLAYSECATPSDRNQRRQQSAAAAVRGHER